MINNIEKINYCNLYLSMINNRISSLQDELSNINSFPENKYRLEAENYLIDFQLIKKAIENHISELNN